MIRFGAIVSVVAVAIGLLVAGAVSGDLALVYVSIGLASLALLMLIVGVLVWRDQVFGPAAHGSQPASKRAVGDAAYVASGAGQLTRGAAHPGGGRPAEQAAGDRAARPAAPVQQQEWRDRERGGNRDRVPGRDGRPGREQAPGRDARPGLEPIPPLPPAGARPSRDPTSSREPRPADRAVAERQIPGERAGRPAPGARPAAAERQVAAERAPMTERFAAGDRPAAAERAATERVAAERAATERVAAERAVAERVAAERVAAERAVAERVAAERAVTERVAAERPRSAGGQDSASTVDTADDPTRLARRMRSAAELSRQVDPDATSTARSNPTAAARPGPYGQEPPSAGPVQSPAGRPATGSDRARLQKEAEAAATAKFTAGPAASSGQAGASAATGPDAATRSEAVPSAADSSATQVAETERGRPSAGDGPAGSAAAASGAAGSVGADGTSSNGGTSAAAPGAASASTADAEMVSVVPGIARYHKSGCILIRFLGEDDLETMSRAAAEESGAQPCRACRPDKTDA